MAIGRLAVTCLTVACCSAGVAMSQETRTAAVTYLTGSSVYVAAGSGDGLLPGTRLTREGEADGGIVLEVSEVSTHRAVCKVVAGSIAALQVGDLFAYQPRLQSSPELSEPAEVDQPGSWARSGVRGRIGVHYLATRNGLEGGPEITQPGIDLRLDGPALFGSPWNFYVNARTRRTTTTMGNGSEEAIGRTYVYRLAFGYDRPGEGWRFNLGRQFAPDLANVSVFDGATAAYDGHRWSAGAFTGTQPGRQDYGYDSTVKEYGAWYGMRAQPGSTHLWSFSTGAVASYENSEINREYLFLLGRYSSARLTGFLTQEVDVNRGWKEAEGENSFSPTSTFISIRYRAADSVDLHAGYDNRRNVRLYRDRVTPLTQFDDSFRRGVWAGVQASPGEHLRFGLSARTFRSEDAAGQADSYTVNVSLNNLSRRSAFIGLRTTRYEDETLEGWLYTIEGALDLGARVRLIGQGGVRNDDSLINPNLSDHVTWYGLDLDIDLLRRLYMTLALEHSSGNYEDVSQLFLSLAYRF